ncbi:hypothetical protein AXA65_07595 [Chryseobacterium sp. FP211-J200]|nr:hypothetical protein AXA65_07595 [Chryseobacterium sp. FP211-J200]
MFETLLLFDFFEESNSFKILSLISVNMITTKLCSNNNKLLTLITEQITNITYQYLIKNLYNLRLVESKFNLDI